MILLDTWSAWSNIDLHEASRARRDGNWDLRKFDTIFDLSHFQLLLLQHLLPPHNVVGAWVAGA